MHNTRLAMLLCGQARPCQCTHTMRCWHVAKHTTHLPLGASSPLTMAGLGLAPAAAATATRPSRRADQRAALMGWPAGVEWRGRGTETGEWNPETRLR